MLDQSPSSSSDQSTSQRDGSTSPRYSESIFQELSTKLPSAGLKFIKNPHYADEDTIVVSPNSILELNQELKRFFPYLMDVCGVDYPERDKRFDVVYHFSHQYHGIAPYVTFGLGLTRTSGYINDGNFFNFNGGIGAQYFLNDTFALDAQIQDLYTNSKSANDLLYTFGVDWQFGGAKDQTVVVPQPMPAVKPAVVNSHNEVAPPDAYDKPLALFKLNSAKVNEAGKVNIQQLAQKLKAQPNARVRLDGFADDTGTFAFNKYLSTKRAQSVAYYLQRDGISAMRIETYGYGNAYPLSSNQDEAGRAMNRRVAAMIIND